MVNQTYCTICLETSFYLTRGVWDFSFRENGRNYKVLRMTTLTLRDLSRKYKGGIAALRDLNLTVDEGELMVLLGPSGCGKTTTLRLISGLAHPSSGDVLFDGRSVLALPPEKRGAVMVFQEHALFPFMSVGDNVAYGLKMRKTGTEAIRRRVAQALTAVQLTGFEDRWPDSLSGGQKQRVALARALVVRPRLLLLDEPLSNLDRSLREDLRQVVRNLQKGAGITTLFVTHDQVEAVAIADRIAVMMDGRLRQVGQPQEFYNKPADAQIARFFGSENFLQGIKQGQVVHTDIGPVEVAATAAVDGPVLLTVRPEAIEVGANGHNNFPALVESCSYRVPVSRCQVNVKGVQLHLAPSAYDDLRRDSKIIVHLPRQRVHVLPIEEI
jgi:ABC-type Fe3+/spermidine/putrescine transport system ATPase subunit